MEAPSHQEPAMDRRVPRATAEADVALPGGRGGSEAKLGEARLAPFQIVWPYDDRVTRLADVKDRGV